MDLCFDLETCPTHNPAITEIVGRSVKAPSNYKDPDKIADYILEHTQAALNKTSVRPEGEIVCISAAVDDDPIISFLRSDSDPMAERQLIGDFLRWLKELDEPGRPFTARLVGFNAIGFDVPRLWQRAMVHDLMVPSFWPRPWEISRYRPTTRVLDVMLAFSQDPYMSMELMAAMFGLEYQGPMMPDEDRPVTGADVYDLWLQGKDELIQQHCIEDVRQTRELAKRIR